MTLNEMWDLYYKMENSKFQKDVLEMIFSIEEIYEQGYFAGNDLFQRINSGSCFVYFITCGEKIKIGVANNVPSRLRQLQTGNNEKMNIFHVIPFNDRESAFKAEAELHKKYSFCSIGGEWFAKDTVISEEFINYLESEE